MGEDALVSRFIPHRNVHLLLYLPACWSLGTVCICTFFLYICLPNCSPPPKKTTLFGYGWARCKAAERGLLPCVLQKYVLFVSQDVNRSLEMITRAGLCFAVCEIFSKQICRPSTVFLQCLLAKGFLGTHFKAAVHFGTQPNILQEVKCL